MPGISLELNTGKLETLPQFHLGSNLDKECSIVFYIPCDTILLTCTGLLLLSKKLWHFQTSQVLSRIYEKCNLKSVLYSSF
jgi:hypothetical protein